MSECRIYEYIWIIMFYCVLFLFICTKSLYFYSTFSVQFGSVSSRVRYYTPGTLSGIKHLQVPTQRLQRSSVMSLSTTLLINRLSILLIPVLCWKGPWYRGRLKEDTQRPFFWDTLRHLPQESISSHTGCSLKYLNKGCCVTYVQLRCQNFFFR